MYKKIFLLALSLAIFFVANAQMKLVYFIDAGDVIALPLYGTVNATIDWGDGDTTIVNTAGDIQHTYASAGTYTVTITGTVTHFGNGGDYLGNDKLNQVLSWDGLGLTSLEDAFYDCYNLIDVPDYLPSTVTNLSGMFYYCDFFDDPDISNWDVSNVTDMSYMFDNAKSFNQDISGWNVSNVTNMEYMFHNANSFNQNIGNWDVSNVTNMYGMFSYATTFNQDIGNWDVSSVNNMSFMFEGASSFNQNIGNWDVSNVLDMTGMFLDATAFNQDISNWDVSNVKSMGYMFCGARYFNQDIGNWNVSNVTDMRYMFASITQDIHNEFNQDISNWNVSKVTHMEYMFYGDTAFNQDLSRWDVSNVGYMDHMFDNTALSTRNYDRILFCWSKLPVNNDVTLGALGIYYACHGAEGRQTLINDHNWTITDAGIDSSVNYIVPNNCHLDTIYKECSLTADDVTPPTASGSDCNSTINGASNDFPVTGLGQHIITWLYADNKDTTHQTQVVVIIDTTAPVVNCIKDTNIILSGSDTVFTVSDASFDAKASDNCSLTSLVNNVNDSTTLQGQSFAIGEHTITWTAKDKAGNTTTCSFVLTVSKSTTGVFDVNSGLVVYPNPTTGIIKIKSEKAYNVVITDVTGKVIKRVKLDGGINEIDISTQASGLYIIKLQSGSFAKVVKIIKQ